MSSEFWAIVLAGSGCDPVVALVFKMSGRSRRASGGGFDSHPLPPFPFRKWDADKRR